MSDQLNKQIRELIDRRRSMDSDEKLQEAGSIIGRIKQVNTSRAWSNVQSRSFAKSRRLTGFEWLTRVAAILFIPLLIYSLWNVSRSFISGDNDQLAWQELTSPAGIRSQLSLPDGTKVWLNAESTIRFKLPFSHRERDVELSGEAFFHVAKNEKVPFVVHAGNARVKVLGTQFNCKAYKQDEAVDVALSEGKISLVSGLGKTPDREFILKPNDHAVVSKTSGETQITEEDITRYIDWHNNRLVFDNNTLDEVASLLERWYGIRVVIRDEEIRTFRYTTVFENETLQHVVDLLGISTPIETEYVPSFKTDGSEQRATLYISRKR